MPEQHGILLKNVKRKAEYGVLRTDNSEALNQEHIVLLGCCQGYAHNLKLNY